MQRRLQQGLHCHRGPAHQSSTLPVHLSYWIEWMYLLLGMAAVAMTRCCSRGSAAQEMHLDRPAHSGGGRSSH